MRQSRKLLPLGLALALCATTGLTLAPAYAAKSAAKTASATRAKSANALHQFTGYVTALDKTSLTVEKRGKQPRTVVFTRHDEMRTIGELEKNARVTVYYRDEDGHAVAQRIVAKPTGSRASRTPKTAKTPSNSH